MHTITFVEVQSLGTVHVVPEVTLSVSVVTLNPCHFDGECHSRASRDRVNIETQDVARRD